MCFGVTFLSFFILFQAGAPESNDCWCCCPTSLIGSGNFICYGRSTHTPAGPPSTCDGAQSLFANSWVSEIYFMIYVRLTRCSINRVLSLLLPAAFFGALDTSFSPPGIGNGTFDSISDATRDSLLKISRGIAILLLIVWVSWHLFQEVRYWYIDCLVTFVRDSIYTIHLGKRMSLLYK